jgi:protein-disulfide isomerase
LGVSGPERAGDRPSQPDLRLIVFLEQAAQRYGLEEDYEVRRKATAPVLAVVAGAIVLVAALVISSQLGHHSNKADVAAMLRGIPQNGIALGNPQAPVTMIEFSDPQCPYCGVWARDTLPSLVKDYVRTGKLRIEYRGIPFVGPDSGKLLSLAEAAGFQNKLWYVAELEFEKQGHENTGYATDSYLKEIVDSVPGLNTEKALSQSSTPAVKGFLSALFNQVTPAQAYRRYSKDPVVKAIYAALVTAQNDLGKQIATPSFVIGRTGSKQTQQLIGAQPLSTFTKAIDAELSK